MQAVIVLTCSYKMIMFVLAESRAGAGNAEYLSHKVEHSVMQTDWRLKFETTASVGFV